MESELKYALIFVGGVATGLVIAKYYARNKVDNAITSSLNSLGLGAFAPTVSGLVTPQVVG
jgi:ribulose 1,5-bisphosphate synthetase/thiazole synthase